MSIFTDEFFETLDPDPQIALHQICAFYNKIKSESPAPKFNFHLEFFAIAESFIDAYGLAYPLPNISEGSSSMKVAQISRFSDSVIASITPYIAKNRELNQLSEYRKRFANKFGNTFAYEFTDSDIARIQLLLTELRDIISKSTGFDEKHKRRLLKRLENLQSEVHKQMSDLDHLWGLVGDAGVALGKFGKAAKPLVERIKEITNITWRAQSRAEELPSRVPIPALIDTKSNE